MQAQQKKNANECVATNRARPPTSSNSTTITHLIDIFTGLCGCLHVRHSPLLRPALAIRERHLSLVVQITFVAHQEERYALVVLHPQDLFSAKRNRSVTLVLNLMICSTYRNS